MKVYSLKFKLEPEEARKTLTEEELRDLYKKVLVSRLKKATLRNGLRKG